MQGSILSASNAGNQGVILGDDGVRYSFAPQDWRGNTVKAMSGMRVNFEGRGAYAWSVYPLQGADPTSTRFPPPPIYRTTPVIPGVSPAPPQPAVFSHYGSRHSSKYAGPQKSKTTVGLLHFLGLPGSIISSFYIGGQETSVAVFQLFGLLPILIFGLIFPPLLLGFLLLLWGLGFIGGIGILCMSEQKFDEWVHYHRDHRFWTLRLSRKNPSLCVTGECPQK